MTLAKCTIARCFRVPDALTLQKGERGLDFNPGLEPSTINSPTINQTCPTTARVTAREAARVEIQNHSVKPKPSRVPGSRGVGVGVCPIQDPTLSCTLLASSSASIRKFSIHHSAFLILHEKSRPRHALSQPMSRLSSKKSSAKPTLSRCHGHFTLYRHLGYGRFSLLSHSPIH